MAKTVLVVDDKTNVRTLLREYLSEEGFRVVTAANGREALYTARHEKPDLILLDIMMPDIKGTEVCRTIKSDEETKDTQIIVLSAYLDEEKFEEMKRNGADLCFSKPLPLPQLKEEVARLLNLD